MKPLAQQNLYEILEITPDSTAGEIEAAYARAREVYAPGSIITYSLMSPEDADLINARIEEAPLPCHIVATALGALGRDIALRPARA